jgi:hypothetical protein
MPVEKGSTTVKISLPSVSAFITTCPSHHPIAYLPSHSSRQTGRERRDLVSPSKVLVFDIANHIAPPRRIVPHSYYGATVTSWIGGGKERLFLSSKAVLDGSKAVSSSV